MAVPFLANRVSPTRGTASSNFNYARDIARTLLYRQRRRRAVRWSAGDLVDLVTYATPVVTPCVRASWGTARRPFRCRL